MSIAILALGFREPAVLASACSVYAAAGFDVYVHVDAKIDLADYKSRMGDAAAACRFLDERRSIFWAGFSMIEATLDLMRAALPGGYRNYALVSDDSFPIRSPSLLRAKLTTDHQRISARPVQDNELFAERYRKFFSFDHPVTSLHGRTIESACFDDALLARLARLDARRRAGKADLALHYGSQWCSLTKDAVELVLDIHENRVDVRESFEFSAVPDEIYFQSVLMNFLPGIKRVQSPMLVDWSRQPRPFVFQSVEDIVPRIGEDHCFVRKVSAKNADLLADLLRLVLGEATAAATAKDATAA